MNDPLRKHFRIYRDKSEARSPVKTLIRVVTFSQLKLNAPVPAQKLP